MVNSAIDLSYGSIFQQGSINRQKTGPVRETEGKCNKVKVILKTLKIQAF